MEAFSRVGICVCVWLGQGGRSKGIEARKGAWYIQGGRASVWLQGELELGAIPEGPWYRYSRHKASSSSSPWAQVWMPSQTLLAGMQLLRSPHRKPVLFICVTQAWAPGWAGRAPEGSRVVFTRASPSSPPRAPTELERGARAWHWRWCARPSSTTVWLCWLCDYGWVTWPLCTSGSLSAKWGAWHTPRGAAGEIT